MFKIPTFFLSLTLSIFCSACATSVTFYDRVDYQENTHSVSTIYVDRIGDIYPEREIFDKWKVKDNDYLRCDFNKKLCMGDEKANSQSPIEYAQWRGIQASLWEQRAKDVFENATKSSGNPPLVFLFHGFRVEDSRRDYAVAQGRINQLLEFDEPPHFVEIHWDGYKSSTSPTGIGSAWTRAQASAPLVGYNLRQFFNALAAEYEGNSIELPPIRILSHSSGAIVIGSLFGNPETALSCLTPHGFERKDCKIGYPDFYTHRSSINTRFGVPQIENMRIAMLAAATPSNTFSGGYCPDAKSVQECLKTPSNIKKGFLGTPSTSIIIGLNKDDIALTRGIKNTSILGATGLGANLKYYCDVKLRLDQSLITPKARASISMIDMMRTGADADDASNHGFSTYLLQSQSTDFIKSLFSNDLSENTTAIDQCSKFLTSTEIPY